MFFGLGSCSSGCDGLLRDQASSFVGTPAWLPTPSGDKLRSPKAAGHAEHKWTSSGETGLFTRPADSTTGDSPRDWDGRSQYHAWQVGDRARRSTQSHRQDREGTG